jgi:hypothetical protein
MTEKTSVLFVCLGNICRSTMAEGIMQHLTSKPAYKDLIGTIDSCGTGVSLCLMLRDSQAQRCGKTAVTDNFCRGSYKPGINREPCCLRLVLELPPKPLTGLET